MDADERALLALEREAASLDANWASGGGDGDEMEAELAREEARMEQLLRSPHLAKHMADATKGGGSGGVDGDLDDLDAHDSGAIHDDEVLGELADLEHQLRREGGSSSRRLSHSNHHPTLDVDDEMDEDVMLAEAEEEAERIAQEEARQQAQRPQPPAKPQRPTLPVAGTKPAPSPPARPPKPATAHQQVISASSSLSVAAPAAAPAAASSASIESLPALSARLLTLKQKAVELNRAGKKQEAMDVMRNYKAVQAKIEELTRLSNPSAAPAVNPSSPKAARPVAPAAAAVHAVAAATLATVNGAASTAASSKLTIRAQLEYDSLLAQLDAQIASLAESMKTLVAEGGGAGIKAGTKESKLLALQYFRAKQRSTKDREILALARARGLKPPATHMEELVVQQELSFPALPDDAVEVLVSGGRELHNSRIVSTPSDLVPSVSVALEYAVDMDGNMKTGVAQLTPTAKGANPSWAHTLRLAFPYSRANPKDKLVIRKLLRGRVLVVLQHKRFLFGAVEVARGDVRLKEMGMKSEVTTAVKLKDAAGNRCGELDVTLRLRRPFEGVDLRQIKMSILVVDEFEEPEQPPAPIAAAVVPVAAPAPTPPAANTVVRPPVAVTTKPASSSASTVSAAASASAPTAAPAAAPAAVTVDPHLIAKMRSNDVLEAEIARLTSQLTQLKQHGSKELDADGVCETTTRIDELTDRVTAAQVQLDVLVTHVQNGKLTLADYIAQLKQDIVTESQLALQLAKTNRKPDAALVVERVKIMKAEVAGAEENLAELEA